MNKHTRIVIFALALIAILLLATGSAAAKSPRRTEFTGMFFHCAPAPTTMEREWYTGGTPGEPLVWHVRGWQPFLGRFVSGDLPLFNGTSIGSGDGDIKLDTGSGTLRGRFSKQPIGEDGMLEGTLVGHYTNFLATMRAVGHGTGDLKGVTYFGDYVQLTEIPTPPAGCDAFEAYAITGVLLDTRGD